jgi:hypothetical protein
MLDIKTVLRAVLPIWWTSERLSAQGLVGHPELACPFFLVMELDHAVLADDVVVVPT